MAQILIRNLDSATVDQLKERASRNRRSLQAEVKGILESSAATDPVEFARQAADLRQRLAERPQRSDSVELLRHDRSR